MAKFYIDVLELEGVTVVRPHGAITLDVASEFREKVGEVILSGTTRVAVDMEDVPWADSTGIGELVSLVTTAYNRQVILVFAAFSSKLKAILTIQQLITVTTFADSLTFAIDVVKDITFAEFAKKHAYKKLE